MVECSPRIYHGLVEQVTGGTGCIGSPLPLGEACWFHLELVEDLCLRGCLHGKVILDALIMRDVSLFLVFADIYVFEGFKVVFMHFDTE